VGRSKIAVILAAGSLAACAKPPATAPVFPVGADERGRMAFYEDYRVTADIGAFSATWKRRDGEYAWPQLEHVAQQFPGSADVYSRAGTRDLVLGTGGGIGGGIVGFTLGWNLVAKDDRKMTTGTQIALYSVGGGLILVSLITGLAWHDPKDDFAAVYNRELRAALGLPPEPGRPEKTSRWIPRHVGAGEYAWTF
jgi:hypothetical protein